MFFMIYHYNRAWLAGWLVSWSGWWAKQLINQISMHVYGIYIVEFIEHFSNLLILLLQQGLDLTRLDLI